MILGGTYIYENEGSCEVPESVVEPAGKQILGDKTTDTRQEMW
jgi:hypothetical protein